MTLPWASYGDHWRNLRRIASTEILSTKRLQMSYQIRADEVRLLIQWLLRASKKEESEFAEVEMKSVIFELTLNVMMRMIGGRRYCEEGIEEAEEARKFKEMVTETFRLSGTSNLVDFIPALKWIGLSGGIEKSLAEVQEKRDKLMKNLIEEHSNRIRDAAPPTPSSSVGTMIDVLLSLQATEPNYYRDEIINGMMQVMLSAGSDTSTGTMEWALSLLLNNPECLSEAQEEIDHQVGQDRLMEESDLANLPYLRGIILETLRMYPASRLIPPHESSERCTVGGFSIPRGTMLLVNVWAIQNDPKSWHEPEKFRPERFVTGPARHDGFKLLPFGAGRRGCPGEGLAMRIVGVALGSLVQCFEWKRFGEEMIDMSEGAGLTMPKAEPLLARYRPRPIMSHLLSRLCL